MRILIKIVLFPIITILTVVSLILRLINAICSEIITTISMMFVGLLTILLIVGSVEFSDNYPVYIICFIFSEFGLFGLAKLILNGVDNFTLKLRAI